MLMLGGCIGARPERPIVEEDGVRQWTTTLGKDPDQSVVLANGMTLRMWRFRQLFSELSSEHSTYAVLFDASGSVIGWARFSFDESSASGLPLSEFEELFLQALLGRLIPHTD
jgi:hypothetical protein